jgi:hypothetical protein
MAENTMEKLQPLLIPTSPGQVLDRITILQIKAEKTSGLAAHAKVIVELAELLKLWDAAVPLSSALTDLQGELRRVNAELWEIEDRLRLLESKSEFGAAFVQAARSVYKLNDERFRLKCRVDTLLQSALSETKVYLASNQ